MSTTATAKHTPGPWTLSDVRACGPRKVEHWQTNENGHRWKRTVCVISDGNMAEGESEANECLLIAAPDLLVALKAAHDELLLHKDSPLHLQITAAIAKAQGK